MSWRATHLVTELDGQPICECSEYYCVLVGRAKTKVYIHDDVVIAYWVDASPRGEWTEEPNLDLKQVISTLALRADGHGDDWPCLHPETGEPSEDDHFDAETGELLERYWSPTYNWDSQTITAMSEAEMRERGIPLRG